MPNKDGTGPRGEGPRTGRGLGNCSDSLTARNSRVSRPLGRRPVDRGRRRSGNS